MDEQHSIAKARSQLPRLVREAEAGKAVELTRRFSDAWDAFTREVDLEELAMDPDEIFGGMRDQSHGRDTGS